MKNQEQGKPEVSDDEQDDQNESTKKLSKGQKKKLKQLKKKEQEKKKQEALQAQQAQKVEEGPKKEENATQDKEANEQKTQKKGAEKKQQKKDDKKKKGGKVNAVALLAKKRLEDLQKFEEQQQRKRKQREAEQERIRKQQEQRKRKEKEQQQRKKKEQEQRIRAQKVAGLFMSKKQKLKYQKMREQLEEANKIKQKNEQIKQGTIEEEVKTTQQIKREEQKKQRQEQKKQKQRKKDEKLLKDDKEDFKHYETKYRSPVCCILGHVDTGKTTLLDKIRNTNVQEGEAGGITQQIGATFFPQFKLIEEIQKCKKVIDVEVDVPGLLIIDTPGHESFSNLRSRGSSLCDIAILVIDLQHGLENQTLQSLELLKKGGTPFVVALNKIDRSYGWKAFKDGCSVESLNKQNQQALHDYKTKLGKVILQLNQKGYNAAEYFKFEDPEEYIPLIPTSGITGEGIPDLLSMIVQMSLANQKIEKRIEVKKNVFKCTVMEVKMIEGYGTTIDCLLVDGGLKKQDQIVLLGFQGPIVTKVKAILTPHPMKQMRIKDEYIHHNEIMAANGVKIAANGLDKAVAGSPLVVANTPEEVEEAIALCKNELSTIQKKFQLKPLGVGVSASTLGSLQALLQYLTAEKIPVSNISVGPVSKEDVIRAMKSLLSEVPERRKQEFACLLVFDIKVLPDAQKFAEENGIKIFTANIIYHLTEMFSKHVASVKQQRREKEGKEAIFPCILKQVATFRKSDPIVLGVDVEAGILKIGTPICVYRQGQKNGEKMIKLGVVESIEHNHKKLTEAKKKNGSVAISLGGDPSIMSGRHFQQKDQLASIITRRSIDCLKQHYREEAKEENCWDLVVKLKKYFNVN